MKFLAANIYDLQGEVNKHFHTKIIPRISFHLDTSPRYAQHIDEVIRKYTKKNNIQITKFKVIDKFLMFKFLTFKLIFGI